MANDVTENVNSSASDLAANTTHCCSSEEYNDWQWFLLSYPDIAMWKFISPIIIVLGTFGNVMTIVIMRRMSEGQSSNSMSLYFTALALSDLVILYAGLLRDWLRFYLGIHAELLHIFFCKLLSFLVYSSCMISSWLIVSMTMQRVMSVVWSHYKSLSCTKRKNRLVLATVVVVPIALNAHRPISYEVMTRFYGIECRSRNEGVDYYDNYIYPWLDLALSSIFPFCILIVANSVLLWNVIQSVQVARVMTAGGCDQVNSRQKKASSLTVTLITVSMVFLLLSMPVCIHFIVAPYVNNDNNITSATLWFVCTMFNLFWYSNSAITFYLYCLTGSRFRNELKFVFCGRPLQRKLSTATFLTNEKYEKSRPERDF